MPYTLIEGSPLVPGTSPVRIFYRDIGGGFPLVFLHGGWGYEIYPFNRQVDEFKSSFRIVIPDRSGYGRSMRMSSFPTDFHSRAAIEMARTLKSLGLERPVLWGHSDGAVIAVMMALDNPELYSAIILEAFHYYRVKPASRPFFETISSNPLTLGERVTTVLSRDHGEDYWQTLILNNGRAWLRIADESIDASENLYGGRLSGLSVPTLFIHGGRDPRTEPGELDAVRGQLPQTPVRVIETAGHSPHSEPPAAMECNRLARDFLASISNNISV